MSSKSEIRQSVISNLLEKVRRKNYKKYILSVRLDKIRLFNGDRISFDFPVTALIGPNGGGKSTVIGTMALAYQNEKPTNIFKKSRVGDESMDDWSMEFEVIDKTTNKTGTEHFDLTFVDDVWSRSKSLTRDIKLLSISRTVPVSENPLFSYRRKLISKSKKTDNDLVIKKMDDIDEIKTQAEKILGKSLANFDMYEFSFQKYIRVEEKVWVGDFQNYQKELVPRYKNIKVRKPGAVEKQYLYVGSNGSNTYSEFNFGAGETSILRMVAEMENAEENSLILIEEIENGLHPIAVKRVVEYLIDISKRKNLQIVFTTHSDYALEPLPAEAIWSCVEGSLQQGKLSIETLRAISGRFDKKLAIFVEDEFAKIWLEYVIREKLNNNFEEIGVYSVGGDGNAVKVHEGHKINPSIKFSSICFIDGDSQQIEDDEKKIYRLPGDNPELTILDGVLKNLDNNIALLTVACQKPLSQQDNVKKVITEISKTNRDPHLLYSQIGYGLGFISAEIIRGAFLSIWVQENETEVENIVKPIENLISL